MNFFNRLSLNIIYNCGDSGVSKVKLAKIFYLTHKWLIQKNLATADDWAYIRMPLGPVPVDFNSLKTSAEVEIKSEPTSLSYNREVYTLSSYLDDKLRDSRIDEVVKRLDRFSTSLLVQYTHKEPSWVEHDNGEEYKITKKDLQRRLPNNPVLVTLVEDKQRLQGQLIEGMIEEIVEGSTALEYPEEK